MSTSPGVRGVLPGSPVVHLPGMTCQATRGRSLDRAVGRQDCRLEPLIHFRRLPTMIGTPISDHMSIITKGQSVLFVIICAYVQYQKHGFELRNLTNVFL